MENKGFALFFVVPPAYPFFRVFVLALKGVRFGYPIALDSPWKKGYGAFAGSGTVHCVEFTTQHLKEIA